MCRNRAGLVSHEKRKHRVNEERVRFACERYGKNFEDQRFSYVTSCTAEAVV